MGGFSLFAREVRPYVYRISKYRDGITLCGSMATCRPYHFGGSFLVPKSGRNGQTQNDSSLMEVRKTNCPKLKFCGFTRHEDVRIAIDCGADALGFNFYPASPRYVSTARAAEFSALADGKALRVGVFVNETPQRVAEIVRMCPLDAIQLHGDESKRWAIEASTFPELRMIPIWKAIAWRGTQHPEDAAIATQWSSHVTTFLVDAHDPVQRGGTGKTARWDLLAPRPAEFQSLPYLLAGGLKLSNLAEAIAMACPDGIDLASGIESSPGVKDPILMKQLADLAKQLLGI
jgi:phosphoribosylanthranilate isomerase